LGVDYGLGRRFSVGLGIGDLAVLFEDSELMTNIPRRSRSFQAIDGAAAAPDRRRRLAMRGRRAYAG
jgi:hypothetical protein